jgi:hypothetical protein
MKKVSISENDATLLRKLNDLRTSNASFVESVRVAGERRNMELLAQGRELWTRIAKEYSLDLEHEQYDISPDGNELVLLAVRYGE